MKTTTLAAALLTTLGLSTVAAPAMAYEAGDWLVRGRVINVNPNDDSGQPSKQFNITDNGDPLA